MNKVQNTDLNSLLKDPQLLALRAYLAGEWVDAKYGKTFPVTNRRGWLWSRRWWTSAGPRRRRLTRPMRPRRNGR